MWTSDFPLYPTNLSLIEAPFQVYTNLTGPNSLSLVLADNASPSNVPVTFTCVSMATGMNVTVLKIRGMTIICTCTS